nr:rhomboid family intramembrane serine protease [Bacteroidetes bacterium endosymbiont of Geopemphigus sp.]
MHADWAHLFFNMLTLYFFGPVVINHFSNNLFLFIYFGSILGGWLF